MTELPDRLLRDALRPTPSKTPSSMCVDAEALAGWADGTMSGAARAAFEIHAAECERCQALMAAMARSEPPPIEPAWWRRSYFSWLMPLAAATAAIVIVVSLATTERRATESQASRDQSSTVSAPRAEETAASRAARPSAPAASASPAPVPAKPDPRRDRVPTIARAVPMQERAKDAASVPAPKAEPGVQAVAATAAPQPVAALPPSPPSAAPATPAPKELAAAAPAAAAGATVNADATRSFSSRDRVEARPPMKAATPLLIASPARDSQWRIVGGAVGHTDDGGVTWQTQSLGVDLPVRAGAAPAARVCWLAGARGLVLLTTDGAHWRRIGFPESVDLVAVEAADASRATVTTATGRRFSTSDGGQTWSSR